MKKAIKALLAVVALVVVVLLVLRSAPSDPVAIIRVVDAAGKPVAGAVIKPDGLRPKRINGHYGWAEDNRVKPTPVKTDAQGIARVPYPQYVFEKAETSEISFGVEHPDFCSQRPFRVVSAAPPTNAKLWDKVVFAFNVARRRVVTRPEPVVLQRGGAVKVTGFIAGGEIPLTNVYAQLASMTVPRMGYWVTAAPGVFLNRRIPEGTNAVRVFYLPADGKDCFSGEAVFVSTPGKTNELRAELKPGFQLSGSLDVAVPRPVRNGRVQVCVTSDRVNTNGDEFVWRAWTTIAPDGTFSFASLPMGHADVIANCDGFKSRDGPGKVASFCAPQIVQLTNRNESIEVAMEPTATCEITVLNDTGQPLSDAEAWFWPNVLWTRQGSTIFMGWTFNTREVFRAEEDFDWRRLSKKWPPAYQGRSDARGVAIVSNLPGVKLAFAVTHTNFELPIDPLDNERYERVPLAPGETNRTTVRMHRKGVEFLKSPR
jgi:hypothetical protein